MPPSIPPCGTTPPLGPGGEPIAFDLAWRTPTVVGLAAAVREEGAFDRMPVLADALEEAGCDLPVVLRHCRECPTHVPGYWVLHLILGGPPASWAESDVPPLPAPGPARGPVVTAVTRAASTTGFGLLLAAGLAVGVGVGEFFNAYLSGCGSFCAPIVVAGLLWAARDLVRRCRRRR